MATTANGQAVIFNERYDGGGPRLRKWVIPGTNRTLILRDGSMGFLLVHMALYFDEAVERLDRHGEPWDEWGWAVRPIRGESSGYSQHAGGVAEDLNATRHPQGVSARHTFTSKQIAKIRWRLRLYSGCVGWGGLWSYPDPMHFEITKVSLAKCERRAKVLMRSPRGRRILSANPGAKKFILS